MAASFPAIRIEGGLFGPELLEQAHAGELPGQKPADFGFEPKRNLTDEIAALFSEARELWAMFLRRRERLAEGASGAKETRDFAEALLKTCLGYELHSVAKPGLPVDDTHYELSHLAGTGAGAPVVHIVPATWKLGSPAPAGKLRLAPHSLVQDFLNRTEHVWGLVTNGLQLRLLRDSTLIRRQAYLEFDLEELFEEQRFADFALLFRLLHRTRLPRGEDHAECLLQRWFQQGIDQGDRVRERLRVGVEEAIKRFANGFLEHPANADFRARVRAGKPNSVEFFRQLLRIIYRLLFLMVSEERGLLSRGEAYLGGYSVSRLRRLAERPEAYDDHDDLWHSLRAAFRVFQNEELATMLAVPALNGELFAPLDVDALSLRNTEFLAGLDELSRYDPPKGSGRRRVNFSALDVEELGSVYESLLELHPDLDLDLEPPAFDLTYGSGRKESGSFYTPPALVNEQVKSALIPVLEARLAEAKAAAGRDPAAQREAQKKAILRLRVLDPACGSGHMLLAGARTLARAYARIETGDDEPAPEQLREATRVVIGHCLYGVDKNPLAVDLCRVALWLEGHAADKPLAFLDHRIRGGDSLIGLDSLAPLALGIPDKAFSPLTSDDRSTAREVKARNRDEREALERRARESAAGLQEFGFTGALTSLARQSHAVDDIPDDTAAHIREKKQRAEALRRDPEWQRQKLAADLWTAAFYAELTPESEAAHRVPTSGVLADHLEGRPVDARTIGAAQVLAGERRGYFFHWPLEFPEVFADGGFDCVLSNPPWERVKIQEKEWFSVRAPHIAEARNANERKRLIAVLAEEDPELYADFRAAIRGAEAASGFMRHSGQFPLCGVGDINIFATFAERIRRLLADHGRMGVILPSAIAMADTTKNYFRDLVDTRSLVSFFSFTEIRAHFLATDSRDPFCLMTAGNGRRALADAAEFVFFADKVEDLVKPERRFRLTAEDIALLNPNTRTCPLFRTGYDAEITKAIYRRMPVLIAEGKDDGNPWHIEFGALFHMSNDSHHFRLGTELEAESYRREGNVFTSPYDRYLPLYEAKMLHQFDHRWATYLDGTQSRELTPSEKIDPRFVVQPRYWVREPIVESALPQFPKQVAQALGFGDPKALRQILFLWVAGAWFEAGQEEQAKKCIEAAERINPPETMTGILGVLFYEKHARNLQASFPLQPADVQRIAAEIEDPTEVARELVQRFSPRWLLGYREITRATDTRTLISSACPKTAVGNKFLLTFFAAEMAERVCLLAVLNSFVCDFVGRQKLGGTTMAYFVIRQVAVPPPAFFREPAPWLTNSEPLAAWVRPRVLELAYTAWDLREFARDCGHDGPPFAWDEARRHELRCELDAAFFHFYGLTRDESAHILDSFHVIRERSPQTAARILALYDEMAAARDIGGLWRSQLNPPPGVQQP